MAGKVTGVSYLKGKSSTPAWQNSSTTWKPDTSKTYGTNKYATTPGELSAGEIAGFQDEAAAAKSDVTMANNRLTAGKTTNKLWETTQRKAADRAVGQQYGTSMATAGGAGTGRSSGFRGRMVNGLVNDEAATYAGLAQQVAERNQALQQVLDEAKQRQSLVNDSINRRGTLSGTDTAKLIRSLQ